MKMRQFLGRVGLQISRGSRVVGWAMSPEQTLAFFRGLDRTVLTFFGYMAGYEDEPGMQEIARTVLRAHSPDTTVVNCGVTRYGMGAIYPLAKSLGFSTAGIVSNLALADPRDLSPDVDHICFLADDQWGGRLPGSTELSPTSRAMVACSDLLVAIGGGEISRDELLAARELGKPIQYFPAEIRHDWLIRRARQRGQPPPASFLGPVHEALGPDAD